MAYEMIQHKIKQNKANILALIDKNLHYLAKEYTDDLRDNYESDFAGDEDSYRNFGEYLKDYTDEYIDDIFSFYLWDLFKQVGNVTPTEIETLTQSEKDELCKPYLNYFKINSGMGSPEQD